MNKYYSGYGSSNNDVNFEIVITVIIVIFVLAISLYRPVNKASDIRNVTVTVTDKEVKNYDDESKYLIFGEDSDGNVSVFEITDSLFMGRFDSSDTYGGIKVGKTYTFKIGGSRNELFSYYPNIYEYKLVETKQ